ncbi:MAG: hypothetical protein ACRCZF_22065 [Gemmataceae bacterium]
MKKFLMLTVVVAIGSTLGCKTISGPFEARKKPRIDAAGTSLDEQKFRSRDKHTLPEDDFRIGPSGYIDRPGPTGR